MKREPTVVSLFCGCGGSSLGYKQAGFREVLAIDWDTHAVKTFQANFPEVLCLQEDISAADFGEKALRWSGLREGELDVLDGSPPCQGFSLSGNRKVSDGRNLLFDGYVRALRALKPRALVMENVKGLVVGSMRGHFNRMVDELAGSGYRVRAKLLDASGYGVPQARVRVIFVGIREDLGKEPAFPEASRESVTVRQALRGVKNGRADLEEAPAASKTVLKLWRRMESGCLADCREGKRKFYSFMKLDPDRPAYCSTACSKTLHWQEPRCMTIPELLALQGFPPDFRMEGGWAEKAKRIGNSVPPPLMRAVAERLRKELES